MDLFDTRKMLQALEQMMPPRTFFLDTFFKQVDVSETESVDIDIDRGGTRKMAPFVSRRLQGKMVERTGFKTFTYKPPYIKPKRITTAADVLKRSMGQHVYAGNKGPAIRAAEILGKDLAELQGMITRREEWMAATALQTGTVVCKGDGFEETINFDMRADHKITLSGNALWSAPTTATPVTNIKDWARLISKNSGLVATDIVLGREAANHFLKNTAEVIGANGLFNQLRINNGQINPTALPNGVKYYGYLTDPGVDVWSYDEWYFDEEAGIHGEMMHPKKVLVGSRAARCIRHYAAISDLECLASVPVFPKSWPEKDPSGQILLLQSAPLPAPHQIDAFACATVLA